MTDPRSTDTVLIVDDTPANLSVLLQCLNEAGHHVLVAEDGEEALSLMTRRVPDLVLLDVMMPGIDGFETCRRMKQNPTIAEVPVIFMTALSETSEKLEGFASGAVDYITKPIQHEEALARVSTHLALRRLRRQIATELTLKERFMRIASHDLRNPLCLASFATTIARRKISQPDVIKQQLDEVDEAVDQMRGIIDTFLELQPPAQSKAVDMAAVVFAAVRQHQSVAAVKNQHLECENIPAELASVTGSATLLYQIVTNFLSNALKFTPRNGNVSVQLSQPNPQRVRVEVIDNGPGVPPSERAQLFAENVRLSNRPTGDEDSHGYGLSIAKQLAEQLGGRVGVEFPDSGGSIFWSEFPAASGAGGSC